MLFLGFPSQLEIELTGRVILMLCKFKDKQLMVNFHTGSELRNWIEVQKERTVIAARWQAVTRLQSGESWLDLPQQN